MSIDPLAVSGMCLRKLSSAKYPSFFSVMETEIAESVLVFKKLLLQLVTSCLSYRTGFCGEKVYASNPTEGFIFLIL